MNLLRIMDLAGIVNEFRWFYVVAALCVATTSNWEFYGIGYGNLSYLGVAVSNNNPVLAIDGSCWYLSVITIKLKYTRAN